MGDNNGIFNANANANANVGSSSLYVSLLHRVCALVSYTSNRFRYVHMVTHVKYIHGLCSLLGHIPYYL
jgi:hypothetical protein